MLSVLMTWRSSVESGKPKVSSDSLYLSNKCLLEAYYVPALEKARRDGVRSAGT